MRLINVILLLSLVFQEMAYSSAISEPESSKRNVLSPGGDGLPRAETEVLDKLAEEYSSRAKADAEALRAQIHGITEDAINAIRAETAFARAEAAAAEAKNADG